jgi:hypothetical protein
MKLLYITVCVCVVFAVVVGCGVTTSMKQASLEQPKPTSLLISWSSDGNHLVPVCNGATQNCKKDFTVLNKTTGEEVTLPITALSYTASNPSDTYSVKVNGFDGQGNSISSSYAVVEVQ